MLQISAQEVKELRNQTGAGMMDCKKALQASNGDMKMAVESLRKKGLASASKKSGRVATEGLIESYVHSGSRIGVLVEINCETDFVARRKEFQNLAKNIAMQIVACPSVEYISIEDIPKEIIETEKRIEAEKEDLINKSDKVKEKIIEGRITKRLRDLSLLDQSFIREPSLIVDELIKQHVALLGENIKIRRFQKFILGEGLEKRENNFGSEVAKILES